ncbi:MAG: Rrf2 family transcriptional regulator [Pirellulales bacterium]|nr:Rrf2 family transcriptional regulator [Pirellulales bacterium]
MLSAKTQYAILALLELSQEHGEGLRPAARPTTAASIAQRHGIPSTFLVQILHELKRAGVVASVRGPCGGYRLSRTPGELTLADVVDVLEATEPPHQCAAGQSPFAPALVDVCGDLTRSRRDILASVTLAELADRGAAAAGAMWHI